MIPDKLTEKKVIEAAAINSKIAETVKLLESDTTGKYDIGDHSFDVSSDLVPNCRVYHIGTIRPIGCGHLPSDWMHLDELQAAYNRYRQMVATARDIARQMIEQSKTVLYYHDGHKFVRISPKTVMQRQSPKI